MNEREESLEELDEQEYVLKVLVKGRIQTGTALLSDEASALIQRHYGIIVTSSSSLAEVQSQADHGIYDDAVRQRIAEEAAHMREENDTCLDSASAQVVSCSVSER